MCTKTDRHCKRETCPQSSPAHRHNAMTVAVVCLSWQAQIMLDLLPSPSLLANVQLHKV